MRTLTLPTGAMQVTNVVAELLHIHQLLNLALDRADELAVPARDAAGAAVEARVAPTREYPLGLDISYSGDGLDDPHDDLELPSMQIADTLNDLYEMSERRKDPLLRAVYYAAGASYRWTSEVDRGAVPADSVPPSVGGVPPYGVEESARSAAPKAEAADPAAGS